MMTKQTTREATTGAPSPYRRLLGIAVIIVLCAALLALLWYHTWLTLLAILLAPASCPWLAMGLIPGFWRRRGKRPRDAIDDLKRRRPVWSVLSELYLDTELDESDHERICSVLVRSKYSALQLEEILYRELHPVLFGNLLSVAGEWAGFDEQWLEQSILALKSRPRYYAIVPWKWMVRGGWAMLRHKLEEGKR